MIDERSHIRGLHHVTAIASGAQANVDFYTRVLGRGIS
jgi:catechol 2,3-dioxygenase-like lactoylglutathione lyase family enzyme